MLNIFCLSIGIPENSPNDADYLRRAQAYSCFGREISPSATFQITNYVGYGKGLGLGLGLRLGFVLGLGSVFNPNH